MEKFWKAAIGVAGLGAVGAFVFWSLYEKWLELKIFSGLNAKQTFIVMIVFLVLTFFALLGIIWAYIYRDKRSEPSTGSITFVVPKNWPFKSTAEAIAKGHIVEFDGFTSAELSVPLPEKQFTAPNTTDALRQIRALTGGKVRRYEVSLDASGKYVLRIH